MKGGGVGSGRTRGCSSRRWKVVCVGVGRVAVGNSELWGENINNDSGLI